MGAPSTVASSCSSAPWLLSLPSDVLTHVLQQSAIGVTELCRLEATSTALRRMVDDDLWHHVFLRTHRPRALGVPFSWKEEFRLRTAWSHGWRTLAACAAPVPKPSMFSSTSTTTRTRSRSYAQQKLRKFALNIVSSLPAPPPTRWATHVVDVDSCVPGVFRSINAALLCCKPYDKIQVQPGIYFEHVVIDKPVEILGVGGVCAAVLVGMNSPAIEVSQMMVCRVANLTLKQQSNVTNPAMTGAVLVKSGAKLVLDECAVSSSTGHAVVVQGLDSRGFITHNLISDAKGVGVLVCDCAYAVIADNEICRNGRAGIAVLSGANPHVRGNMIHSGYDSGVLVSEKGRGKIEGNDISDNRRAGVAILKEGDPIVHNNRIHHGLDSGVLVCENGQGVVRDNEIFANQMAGIAIGRGGASRVTGNTIRDSHGGSLCLSLHSKGVIQENVIQHDTLASMQMPDNLLSQVRERNTVVFTDGARSSSSSTGGTPTQCHSSPLLGVQLRAQDRQRPPFPPALDSRLAGSVYGAHPPPPPSAAPRGGDVHMSDAYVDTSLPRPLPMVH